MSHDFVTDNKYFPNGDTPFADQFGASPANRRGRDRARAGCQKSLAGEIIVVSVRGDTTYATMEGNISLGMQARGFKLSNRRRRAVMSPTSANAIFRPSPEERRLQRPTSAVEE